MLNEVDKIDMDVIMTNMILHDAKVVGTSQSYENKAILLMAWNVVAHGGEVKFNNYSDWGCTMPISNALVLGGLISRLSTDIQCPWCHTKTFFEFVGTMLWPATLLWKMGFSMAQAKAAFIKRSFQAGTRCKVLQCLENSLTSSGNSFNQGLQKLFCKVYEKGSNQLHGSAPFQTLLRVSCSLWSCYVLIARKPH